MAETGLPACLAIVRLTTDPESGESATPPLSASPLTMAPSNSGAAVSSPPTLAGGTDTTAEREAVMGVAEAACAGAAAVTRQSSAIAAARDSGRANEGLKFIC